MISVWKLFSEWSNIEKWGRWFEDCVCVGGVEKSSEAVIMVYFSGPLLSRRD